jgi:hypothetical protein
MPLTEPAPPVTPVEIMNDAPLQVAFETPPVKASPHVQQQMIDPSLPARTTFQEDLTTAGQRQINLIWERTQAVIALCVVVTTMGAGLYSMAKAIQIPTLMAMAFGTVVGFYFSRTNHAAIGGVGRKPEAPYEGR